jgi:ADP-ribosylglycohydrolase
LWLPVMTIQTPRLQQTNMGISLVGTKAESKKNPIEVGVDSHKIEFDLGPAHTEKVKTVVGASFDSPTNNDFLAGVAPRLKELATSGATLVSFASITSFQRLAQQDKPIPLRLNSTSFIERVQASLVSNHGNGLKLSDDVTVMSMTIKQRGTDSSGIPYLEGEIEIKSAEPEAKNKTIKFLEFSPEYDGRSLDENTLLNVLQHVSNKNATNQAAVHPHFYSMNGIGRSASLAVLYSFKKLCEEKNGFANGEVEGHLNRLIEQGRDQRDTHFVNTTIQKKELLNACLALNNLRITERKRSTDEQPKQEFQRSAVEKKTPESANVNAPNTARQDTIVISKTIEKLVADKPASISNPKNLPYMPINPKGIVDIATDATKFPFPQVGIEQGKAIARDIVVAGFYGDALGADLEAKTYSDKKNILVRNMSGENKRIYDHPLADTQRDKLLIQQLKQNNGRQSGIRHQATDDTQQGVLSAMAKMEWISKGDEDQNKLAEGIFESFRTPTFPVQKHAGISKPTKFIIRGGAETILMCQSTENAVDNWRDVAIEGINVSRDRRGHVIDISTNGKRAGGAGNGGLMRIGYDLLPMLASGASMQDLVEQALISNQVTHPSSFSAVASVGQVVLMAKCIDLRIKAEEKGESLIVPPNFFIDTFHEVAKALEFPAQKFGLHPSLPVIPEKYESFTSDEWCGARLPSEFLKGSDTSTEAVQAGCVEQALKESPKTEKSSEHIDSVLQRWSSNSYLGATFPSVVFLLEKFGREDPALAVNMTALVTKDSDTCATIVAQVMGALYGSEWVDRELESCKNSQGLSTFNENLGGGFELGHFIGHINNFFDQRVKL